MSFIQVGQAFYHLICTLYKIEHFDNRQLIPKIKLNLMIWQELVKMSYVHNTKASHKNLQACKDVSVVRYTH